MEGSGRNRAGQARVLAIGETLAGGVGHGGVVRDDAARRGAGPRAPAARRGGPAPGGVPGAANGGIDEAPAPGGVPRRRTWPQTAAVRRRPHRGGVPRRGESPSGGAMAHSEGRSRDRAPRTSLRWGYSP